MRIKWLVFIITVLLPVSAHATRYWVATTGSDANSCAAVSGDADPGTYRLTPLNGAACLTSAGDRLTIKAGTYTGANARVYETTVSVANGTAGNVTIIEGDPSDADGCAMTSTCSTILQPGPSGGSSNLEDASYIRIQKLAIDNTNRSSVSGEDALRLGGTGSNIEIIDVELSNGGSTSTLGANGLFIGPNYTSVTVRRVHSHDNGNNGHGHGVYYQADNGVVEYSSFHDNSHGGIQLFNSSSNSDGDAKNNILRYCNIYSNKFGVAVDGNDNTITRNIIRGHTNNGIDIGYNGGSARTIVTHNVIYNNTGTAVYIGIFTTAADDGVVRNNIIYTNGDSVFIAEGNTGTTLTHNACATSDSCGTTGKVTLTALTNCTVSTSDFTQVAGSTCIDAGVDLGVAYNSTAPDIGAFETLVHSVCTVEDGDASTLRITLFNNVHPPLQVTDATGLTARDDGGNNVVTGVAITGDNRVDLTLTDAITNGQTVDYSYAQTGDLRDSTNIGGTLTQEYLAITNQSCTNNVGAAPTYTFTQAHYEYHYLRGTEAAPIILAAGEDATRLEVAAGGFVRIRFSVECGTADCPATGFYPRYNLNGGGYNNVVPNSFDADNIQFCGTDADPDIPGNGTATTEQLTAATGFVAGALVRTSNAIPTVDMDHTTNTKTELEYCVMFDTDATGSYAFRIYEQDGSALDTYTNTPTITLVGTSGGSGF